MLRFHYKRRLDAEGVGYDRQFYIYSISRSYRLLSPDQRAVIDELCERVGGENAAALKAFLTSDRGVHSVALRYYVSESTLNRMIKRYYLGFPKYI